MNILDTIIAQKRIEIAKLNPGKITAADLQESIRRNGPRRDFAGALRENKFGGLTLIAEVKKASPSAGIICEDFNAVLIAREYEAAGASCLSVLTDEKFFQGSLSYLKQIRDAVNLPLLRKDFIIDERQILQAIEWGADGILLIVSILSDAQLKEFLGLASAGSLAALVEVHDESELDRALAAGAQIIGVNNRDLKSFKVDLSTTERLAAGLRNSAVGLRTTLVAESGIHTRADVERVSRCGAHSVLVGESLIRSGNIRSKMAELLGLPPRVPSLSNAQLRDLRARAQRLKATLKIGKDGLSAQFLMALDEMLKRHELVKIKFENFKEQKKELAPQLAQKSASHLVARVGNVVVLYRASAVHPEVVGKSQFQRS